VKNVVFYYSFGFRVNQKVVGASFSCKEKYQKMIIVCKIELSIRIILCWAYRFMILEKRELEN